MKTTQTKRPFYAVLSAAIATLGTVMVPQAQAADVLDAVVVTATRTEKPITEVASSVSVVTEKEVEQRAPSTFAEALLDQPNVDVSGIDSFSNRISIRGSDANEITYVIDGVRQDNTTMAGITPIGIYIDPDLIKQTEVRHGGGAALYGNGGIGGVIAVETKSARDLLKDGEKFAVGAKTGYTSELREWNKSVWAAGRTEDGMFDTLISLSRRDSGNAKMSSTGRSTMDADSDATSLMVKAGFHPTSEVNAYLTYNFDDSEQKWKESEDEPTSAKYKQHRVTASADWSHGDFVNLKGNLQFAKSDYRYSTYINNPPMAQGERSFKDKYKSFSGNLQNTSLLEFGGEHALTVGADFSVGKQRSWGATPGMPQSLIEMYAGMIGIPLSMAESMWGVKSGPESTRPNAKATDFGLFIQDEYSINQYVSVIPQLRWSYFKRKSSAGYESFDDNKLTPGITFELKPVTGLRFWASAKQGYRPPIMDELYYSISTEDTVVESNPSLKPEKSWNYEIGSVVDLRGVVADQDRTTARLALFYDDVKDFINVKDWVDDSDGNTHFRAENIGHAVRKGLELSADYRWQGLSANFSYGLVHVEDKETHQRVSGITPQSAKMRLGYEFKKINLEPWYRVSWHDTMHADRDDYVGGSFFVHSAGLVWSPTIEGFADFKAGLAVNNIFDKHYRYTNNSQGYGRGVRVWISGRF